IGFFSDATSRRFVIGVLVAFLPAAVIGAIAHDFIKNVLFNPWIVCFTLIAGGAVLLWIDTLALKPKYHDVTTFSLPTYLGIGIAQCAAMVPGVSRSGATIVGAMLMGADRRTAAEFSFWLAMPTMVGAFAYDLYKSGAHLSGSNVVIIAVGFVTSFIFGWIVVKTFLGYVSRHGFALFAWWRVIVGGVGLIWLAVGEESALASALVLWRRPIELVAGDLIDRGRAGQDHGVVEAFADHFQRRRDTGFAHRGKAVEIGASDQTAACAVRQRLEHVMP